MESVKDTKQPLFVRELLENTYEKLGERNDYTEIVLPEIVQSEIADDSDWHRTRTGYIGYDKVRFFNFNDKSWLIGNGKSFGDYPARPFDSDILGLELTVSENLTEVYNEFQNKVGSYFSNSLIQGMADGRLGVSKNTRFAEKMWDLLKPRFNEFVAQMPEYNKEILSINTLTPVNKSPMKYKPGLVDFLAKTIEKVLMES